MNSTHPSAQLQWMFHMVQAGLRVWTTWTRVAARLTLAAVEQGRRHDRAVRATYHRLYQAAGSPVHSMLALRDSTVVVIRTIRPSDRTALQRLHRRLSERSVVLRFFSPMPALSEAQADHFSRVDGSDRFALVALDPAQPAELIAVASYDWDPHRDHAEFAVVVEDRWQGRGLGRGLIRRLIDAARWRGICVLYGLFLPENISIHKALQHIRLPKRLRAMDGTKLLEIDLCTAEGAFAE